MNMQVLYTSAEGNTKHFLTKMSQLFHNVNLHFVDDQTDLYKIKTPYFVFVPAYATYEDNQKKCVELPQTFALTEELAYKKNYKKCLGSIGSGNRNFSKDQYVWTARKLYRQKFGIPCADTYELRGTLADENRINKGMIAQWNKASGSHLVFRPAKRINSRLAQLEQKYHKDLHGNRV